MYWHLKESIHHYDEDEFVEWWPDISSEDELVGKIHLDSIVIQEEYLMESDGENPIYVLFNRDWGGEDLDDNSVAVLIEDGEVSEVYSVKRKECGNI